MYDLVRYQLERKVREIGLEINTPHDSSGEEGKVITSESTWEQENLLLEDGWKLLLTNQAELKLLQKNTV